MNRTQRLACAYIAANFVLLGPTPREGRAEGADDLRPQLVAQVGHSGGIGRIAFAPDGRTVLMAGASPRLWYVATGRLIRPFAGHDGATTDIAYSPDGRYVLSGGWDKMARLWDAATGREVRRFLGHTHFVESVAFFPEGRTVLTGSYDNTVRLWDVETGREKPPSFKAKNRVTMARVSPDGRTVIIGVNGGGGILWDASDGHTIRQMGREGLEDFEGAVFSPDGRWILSWTIFPKLGELRLWDVQSGRLLRSFQAPGDSAAFSPDGKTILTKGGQLWDVTSGQNLRKYDFGRHQVASVAFAPDGRTFLTGGTTYDQTARLWDLASGKELVRFAGRVAPVQTVTPHPKEPLVQVLGAEQHRAASGEGFGGPNSTRIQDAIIWDLEKGREVRRVAVKPKPAWAGINGVWKGPNGERALLLANRPAVLPKDPKTGRPLMGYANLPMPNQIEVSRDGSRVVAFGNPGHFLWDYKTGHLIRQFKASGYSVEVLAFSPDDRWVLAGTTDGTARIWDVATGDDVKRFVGHRMGVSAVAASADARQVVTGGQDRTVRLWDVETEREIWSAEGHLGSITSVAFSPDGKSVLSSSSDGTTGYWDRGTGRELCRLVSFPDNAWTVLAPDGRFDTNRPGALPDLHWIFPDDPFRPLAQEILLRDYYEPCLLPRVLAGETFRPVRPLSTLNRAQPRVVIVEVGPGASPGVASVTVETQAAEDVFGGVPRKTAVYELRLFRDSQLVGCWPETDDDQALEPDPNSPEQQDAWRRINRIVLDPATGRATRTFSIALPHREKPGPVELTAYAFNEDRVKSATATARYDAPANPPISRPRAYLICMGVAASQSPRWDLAFPAADARRIQDVLGGALERQGHYEVVPILLTSERADDGAVGTATATKANLDAALDLLAGRVVNEQTRKRLPGADKLLRATPDDLVVLSFSGHGYTDARGVLYLLPYDVGEGRSEVAEVLPHCISTSELSAWLRNVNAGELAIVVDACHSAAAVQQPGFKPGPLGSRGLGQLAYDKGMQVLAASQADDVAVESSWIRQGLLTYALASDGLEKRRAARDGIVTLKGLLTYAAGRVPELYREVMTGEVRDEGGEVARNVGEVRPRTGQQSAVQKPELFDYDRNKTEVILSGGQARS